MQVLMGRAGTGKTTAILQRIAQRADSGKKQILIVPELASHEYERMLAQVTQNKGSGFAEVLTFRRIAHRIFSETGGLADTMLTPAGRLLVLYESVRRISDSLSLYHSATRKPDVLRDILSVLDEMKCSCISSEEILRASDEAEGHLAAKLRDLGQISAVYDTLTAEELPDPRDQLTQAAAQLPDSTLFHHTEVYFDRFDSFNKQELAVIAYLLERKTSVAIALTGDPTAPEEFPEAQHAAAQLRALAGKYGANFRLVPFTEQKLNRPQDLSILEQYGLRTTALRTFASDQHSVHLHAAGDLFSECEFAAAYIRKLLRETDARRRDIVITARNFEQYAPILELVLQRYEIPVFLSEKHEILQKPVLALVGSALHTVTGGWRYEDIFSYLKTGFAELTADECDLLENYVLFRHIRGSAWLKPFVGSPDRFGNVTDEQTAEQLKLLNELRERIVQPLLGLKQGLDTARTATQYVQVLYAFLEKIGAPERIAERAALHEQEGRLQTAEEYRQLWEILIEAMEQFAWVQGDAPMDTDAFVSLLGLVLAEYDVGTIPVALDRVTCGSIDRVCHTGIPHLIVLGVNDGVIPSITERSILSDSDREVLLGLEVELETGADRMAKEQAAIYRIFASASQTLLLSWRTVSADGEERPSYLIPLVRQLLDGVPETQESELEQSYRLEAERPRFDLACLGAAKDGSAAAQAAFAVTDTPITPIEKTVRGSITDPDAIHGLYGERLRLSASRVDAFYRCPYSYFLKYGLRARERRRAAFDAPETGTFLHYVLEHTMQDLHTARDSTANDAETLRQSARRIAHRWIETYVEQELGGLEQHSARFRQLFRRLERMLHEILDNLLEELARSDFEPIDFELDFSRQGDLPSIRLELDDGALELNGKVDRVDGYIEDGVLYVRVMDYKSGYKKFELSDLWYGLNIQLLLYLFAIENTGLQHYRKQLAQDIDRIVPAGALYIPAQGSMVNAKRQITEEELNKLRRKQLRRSGLILNDRHIIDVMEHGITKEGEFLPLGFRAKDGAPLAASLSNLADLQQLGKLNRHIRCVLRRMGQSVLDGDIDAKPVARTPQDNACLWCPYQAVCRMDTKLGDKMHTIAKLKSDVFWQEIQKEEDQ